MKILTVATLLAIGFLQVFAKGEPTSIIPPGEGFQTSEEELMKRHLMLDDEDDLEMFRRTVNGGGYTAEEQNMIVAAHNEYRKTVSPLSSNMNELVFSSSLAEQAQAWSDRCIYAHPNRKKYHDYKGIGQNLHIKYPDKGGEHPPPATEPTKKWYEEVKNYTYATNGCIRGEKCGHYTQVVWGATSEVGCGITFCPVLITSGRTRRNTWLVACNYSPSGNFKGQKPYKSGDLCTYCKSGFCQNDLCSTCTAGDEGCECNIACQNCGTLDKENCQCECHDGFYGLLCEIECRDKDTKCGVRRGGWPASMCENPKYSAEMRKSCPAVCGVCKTGNGSPPLC